MGSRRKPAIYSIPAHRGFADALAAGIVERTADPHFGLARTILLLPNNRAVRAVTEAFVRRSEAGLLLPRMLTVGDIELDEQLGGALDPIGAGPQVPPAVPPFIRRMILARLVSVTMAGRGQPVLAGEALRLGEDLGQVIDQLHVERLSARDLSELDVGDMAEHWQVSRDLFHMLAESWPAELARLGMVDMAERRNRLLGHVAARWRDNPPGVPVFAAGINSNAPAVADLLKTVAFMPQGHVVLDNVDLAMADEDWDLIGPHSPDPVSGRSPRAWETHPQFHLKRLMAQMGVRRDELMLWTRLGESAAPARRSRAIGNAFLPPPATVKWHGLDAGQRSLAGIRVAEAADTAEEAQLVAIAIREALEEPERTVSFITPDRELARRVSAHLGRWNIAADDSAGRPLSELPQGTLLLAMAKASASHFAPSELLSLLKHPLVMAGEGRLGWLDRVRALDLLLRGPRPQPGLAALAQLIAEGAPKRQAEAMLDWWNGVVELLSPLADMPFANPQGLVDLLAERCTALTGGQVWAGQAGRELEGFFDQWREAIGDGPPLTNSEELVDALGQLLSSMVVRPAYGSHPRVAIYGLLEARLQQADLVICGGLNEGSWPQIAEPDPWLAERIRRELNLPSLERSIGLAAHDLSSALGAPQVLLTRAVRDRSGPTIASRFLLRLKAMAGGQLSSADELLRLARAIDRPEEGEKLVIAPPAPMPTAEQRRVSLSVTAIDGLKADPFSFYARHIMGLRSIEAVDADPGPAWRGTMVHGVLEDWARNDDLDIDRLIDRAQELLDSAGQHPVVRALWAPRLLAALQNVAEESRRLVENEGRRIACIERSGRIEIDGVSLSGKADRIDRLADGSLVILDYKTGQPPRPAQVEAGFALQLGLIGLIAERGGFEHLDAPVTGFEYWSLGRDPDTREFGYRREPFAKKGAIQADNFIADTERHLREAIARWITGDAPFTAKLHPEYSNYSDYDQLMRLDEWYGRQRNAP